MGFAIVWIILFHFKAFDAVPILGEIFRIGELGVDIFLLVSAFGLCHSINKTKSIKQFYAKRLIRIFPTWLFFCLFSILKTH